MYITNYQPKLDTSTAQASTFIKEEAIKIIQSYDDALMLTLQIANHNVYWLLIDNESLMDIFFHSAYNQMRLPPEVFKPTNTPLHEFTGCNVQPFGGIKLFVIAGSHPA